MKLIFAVLDVSLTMGLTRCYKTEGFFTFMKINGRHIAILLATGHRVGMTFFIPDFLNVSIQAEFISIYTKSNMASSTILDV